MKRLLLKYILPGLAYVLFQIWGWTLRGRNRNPEAEAFFQNLPDRFILTHWHSRIFYLLYYFRGRSDFNILVSPSNDAEVLARMSALLGYTVVRGSTYKSPLDASRKLLKALKRDQRVVVVADGSRGPRHKAQLGSIQMARISGAPLIPMTYGANNKKEFNSWDRFILPLPFSTCTLNFGEPIHVPRRASEAEMEEKRQQLEDSLNQITHEVD